MSPAGSALRGAPPGWARARTRAPGGSSAVRSERRCPGRGSGPPRALGDLRGPSRFSSLRQHSAFVAQGTFKGRNRK